LLGLLLLLAISFLVQKTRISRDITHPVVTGLPLQFDLMLGFVFYLGYHVVGGYQHMNFTFRYWIPGLIGAAVVCAAIIRQALSDRTTSPDALPGIAARLLTAPALIALLALQIVQSGFATYEGKYTDATLTVAPMRDQFSIDSYAEYLAAWHRAGHDLSSVVRKEDRLFLGPAMLTGALTDGYLVDQFYFPARESTYWDLRQCVPQAPDRINCAILFDYYIWVVDPQSWPPSHEVWKEYPQRLVVLKRKDFPIPNAPSGLTGVRIAAGAVELKWQPVLGEFYSEVETTDAVGRKITKVPPGYREFRLEQLSGDVSARMRACNKKGCSSWSEPVRVSARADEDRSMSHPDTRPSLVRALRSFWRTIQCRLQSCPPVPASTSS
jgi:hypothetical protein